MTALNQRELQDGAVAFKRSINIEMSGTTYAHATLDVMNVWDNMPLATNNITELSNEANCANALLHTVVAAGYSLSANQRMASALAILDAVLRRRGKLRPSF